MIQFRQRRRGFSLVEILVAVLLVGILMAVAVPRLFSSRQSAADSAARQQLNSVVSEVNALFTDTDSYSGSTAAALTPLLPDITVQTAALANETGNVRKVNVPAPSASQWRAAVRGADVDATTVRCWGMELNKTTAARYGVWTVAAATGCSVQGGGVALAAPVATATCSANVQTNCWQTGTYPTGR